MCMNRTDIQVSNTEDLISGETKLSLYITHTSLDTFETNLHTKMYHLHTFMFFFNGFPLSLPLFRTKIIYIAELIHKKKNAGKYTFTCVKSTDIQLSNMV